MHRKADHPKSSERDQETLIRRSTLGFHNLLVILALAAKFHGGSGSQSQMNSTIIQISQVLPPSNTGDKVSDEKSTIVWPLRPEYESTDMNIFYFI
jgi:hypothetical protein